MEKRLTFYQSLILNKIPFLLSLEDREKFSPTYGCFDRTYWQWKFMDFPCTRYQEALFSISYVYSHNFENNIYYRNRRLLEWIEAGFIFLRKIQHKDGSFDEAYPFERSFVATGFNLFYLTEVFLLIQKYIGETTRRQILQSLKKAAEWIIKNDETHAFISNHRLGACAGLYNLSKILGEKKFEQGCWEIWDTVRDKQSADGWFSEYGGADPGYLTQGIYYAAVLYEKSKNKEVFDALGKVLDFIKYFIHPDGSIGGEYGSRNTEFYFPGGFEILAKYYPIAETICRKMIPPIKQYRVPHIDNVDVYNMIPILNSTITGCLFCTQNNHTELLPYYSSSDFTKIFSDFKIYVRKLNNLYIIIGISKGGVVKVYDIEKGELLQSLAGIFGEINGRIVTSQFIHRKDFTTKIDNNMISIKGPLIFANLSKMSPFKMMVLRFMGWFFGFSGFAARYIKRVIVYNLIFRKRNTKWSFERIISIDMQEGIKVVTKTYGLPEGLFEEMKIHTSYHMGSSKYYKFSDLFTGRQEWL